MNKLLIVGLAVALAGCTGSASMFEGSGSSAAPAQAQHPAAAAVRAPAAAIDSSLSSDDIKGVQQKLTDAGTYHGAIDGKWGPATEAAMRSYQQQHNLQVTGKMNDETSNYYDHNKPPVPPANTTTTTTTTP